MQLPNTSTLKSALRLTEKRDSLLAELASVEKQLAGLFAGKPNLTKPEAVKAQPARSKGAAPAKSKGRKRRGSLKDKVLAALRAAGDKGVLVRELSEKLGVKNQNMHVWFSSTGRKLGTIQRVESGRYRLKPGA